MEKRKWTWRPSRDSLRNIFLLVVSVALVIWLLVFGIRKTVEVIRDKGKTNRAVSSVETRIQDLKGQGVEGPSSLLIQVVSDAFPESLYELSWVFSHKQLYTGFPLSSCKRNQEMIHFLYLLGNESYNTGGTIEFTEEEKNATPPYLKQWDERWGFEAYGDSLIGLTGAGPTVLAMVVDSLSDQMISPKDAADFAVEFGYNGGPAGSQWGIIPGGCDYFHVSGYELMLDEGAMEWTLDNGGLIVAVVGNGHFTTGSTFLLIYGYSTQGFKVYDPANVLNSKTSWPFNIISSEIQALWSIY